MQFTVRVKSELIRVQIAESDANFRIHLLGQGLLFDPPTPYFPQSNEATFRVIGTAIIMKSIVYWRAGANVYSIPLTRRGTETRAKHGSDRFQPIGRGRKGGEAVCLQRRGCKGVRTLAQSSPHPN